MLKGWLIECLLSGGLAYRPCWLFFCVFSRLSLFGHKTSLAGVIRLLFELAFDIMEPAVRVGLRY